jgi:hypothetical protein
VKRPFQGLPNDLIDEVRMSNRAHVAKVFELHDLDTRKRVHE